MLRNELIACLSLDDAAIEHYHPSSLLESDRVNVGFNADNSRFVRLNADQQVEMLNVKDGSTIRTFSHTVEV